MRKTIRDLVITLVLAALVFLLVRFVLGNYTVAGESMEPGLQKGQQLLIFRPAYAWASPQRGDIVFFRTPEGNPFQLKRVIGLPGDMVEVRANSVYINNIRLSEPYLSEPPEYTLKPFSVPPDNYFILGDNRNNSSDSSSGWTVPEKNIQGRAWIVIWPPSKWSGAGHYYLDPQLNPSASP